MSFFYWRWTQSRGGPGPPKYFSSGNDSCFSRSKSPCQVTSSSNARYEQVRVTFLNDLKKLFYNSLCSRWSRLESSTSQLCMLICHGRDFHQRHCRIRLHILRAFFLWHCEAQKSSWFSYAPSNGEVSPRELPKGSGCRGLHLSLCYRIFELPPLDTSPSYWHVRIPMLLLYVARIRVRYPYPVRIRVWGTKIL